MLNYHFIAKNSQGEKREGEMDASSEKEISEKLRVEGFWPISITQVKEKKSKGWALFSFRSAPLKNKMIFCRHLAVMITSGVSLSRALSILGQQEKNKALKKSIELITSDIGSGISLAEAMKKHPGIFNQVFTSMIEVGETGGNLDEILKILADQMEKDHKLISKIRGAMIYPAIIVAVMIIVGILMMMFVVPNVTAIFDEFSAELPIMTRILLKVSDFMANNSILFLSLLFGFIFGIIFFYKTSVGVKFFHKIFLKLPIFGEIIVKVNCARFSRILSSLLAGGVSLVKSLSITSSTLGNYYFKKSLEKSAGDVQKGIALSKILSSGEKVFPYLVIQMIEVGEETGKTPEILLKLAGFYEEEVDQVTKNLSSIIEPVLMVVIGGVVGFFAVAIIQPIYSIMEKV